MTGPDRVPFAPDASFEELTEKALKRSCFEDEPAGGLLSLLEDCVHLDRYAREETRGASYRRLAAIAHLAGMSREERIEWYETARSIPLSDRHAGHVLGRLKR